MVGPRRQGSAGQVAVLSTGSRSRSAKTFLTLPAARGQDWTGEPGFAVNVAKHRQAVLVLLVAVHASSRSCW